MKKFVNVRLPVIIACATASGIALGYVFNFYGIELLWLIAVAPLAAAVFIILTLVCKSWKPLPFIMLAAAFFIFGALGCYFKINSYAETEIINGNTYKITGTVCEKGQINGGEYIIIDAATANKTNLSGKVMAYLSNVYGDFCDVGYNVEFVSEVTRYDVFAYGKLNYNAEDNVKYRTYVFGGLKSKYNFSLFGGIRSNIRHALYDNLDGDTASVCYAMLTGNSQNIGESEMQSFRYGGIAHIFAVSGLHIGIVFGILSFLCKKLKANKYVAAVICILALFFYSTVCGFTLSSLRAAIMCAVSVLCKLFYKKYDALISLSFAVTIILLITPLSLFSVGFQLSVCAVGGIAVLSKNLERILRKIKLPKKIAAATGTSFGAQMGTMPIMLANFGYLSGAGLLLNLVILPVLSALFVVLFVCTFLCVIITPLAPLILPYAALPLEVIMSFLLGAGFEKALIYGFGAGLFVPIYFIGILALSDKLNIKFLTRLIAVVCSVAVLTGYVCAKTYLPANGFNIAVSAYHGGGEVIIKSSQGTVLIVTENVYASHLSATLNKYYAYNLDGIIILGGETCVDAFNGIDADCGDIYVFLNYIHVQPYGNATVHYEKEFDLCGVNFTFYDGYNITADLNGVKAAICTGETVPFEYCDLLISSNENTGCLNEYCVYFELKDYTYNVYDFGDLTFWTGGGKLKMTAILPPNKCLN